MPLTCQCDDDYDFCCKAAEEFETGIQASRCESCNRQIGPQDYALRFDVWTTSEYDGQLDALGNPCEEGADLISDDLFLCEQCGEIYSNLHELGFCVTLGEHLGDTMREYIDEYVA